MGQYQWLIYALLGAVAAAVIAPLGKKGTEGLDSSVLARCCSCTNGPAD